MTQNSQDPWGNSTNQNQGSTSQPQQPYPFAQQPGPYPVQQPQQGYYPQSQQPQQVYYQQPQRPISPQVGYFGGAPVAKKKWPGWATALLVIGVVVILAGIGAASRSNSTTNTQQTIATAPAAGINNQNAVVQSSNNSQKIGKVGDTISLNGYTLTVNVVQKSENFSGDAIDQAKSGNTFIAVDLTIGSQKNSGVSANALYATLKDSQGYSYNTGIFGDKQPSLKGTNDIPNGDKVRGWVTFEVPKTASGFTLEYGQLFESEKIRVSLGI
ncbi:MAG: DUF4352 domain-containing protein [Chloroflexi bacterium]|nr:DUF4352 domain-containing protein [Chloroflexota bacterium]